MKRREFVQGVLAAGAVTAIGWPDWLRAEGWSPAGRRGVARLNAGWRFHLDDLTGAERPGLDDSGWQEALLPHTARIEALVTGAAGSPTAQWQGTCWYRRTLRLDRAVAGRRVLLRFDGAMNVADVFLDGQRLGGHMGGYLPFVLDLSERVTPGRDQLLAVRLDNRDNAITGPKPLAQLDFNTYHGLYRPVFLTVTDRLHITDPLLADQPASGGIFVTYPRVSRASATVRVQTHVRNEHAQARSFRVRATLTAPDGSVAARATSTRVRLGPSEDRGVVQELEVGSPRLWSPGSPDLYTLRCALLTPNGVVDEDGTRIGIRRIAATKEGFTINGERTFLRGTNRHQEYPYVGYAISDAAQYRDARKIKEAGFDFVRLSHYAHAPAFMDACDELGLMVMDCIPGWQYFGKDPAFTELQYRNCRDLLRRDRNHPCVALWEVSLNETTMPPEFIRRTHAIAHEEYPGDQCFTAGWVHGYDVFIQARQHGGCHAEKTGACLVSEYGDWEYYAMNAGFEQDEWKGLTPAESNSRQLRWQGERAQRQQAANFQEAHDDNRSTIAFADGLWVMFDYNRGYAADVESSGCMDIFRLPKYAYHFFRSQRSADELVAGARVGPMAFIASDWTSASPRDVRVFSNCDEVALLLNGRPLERRRPDRDRMSMHLAHPPFTFHTAVFEPGTLEAIGYLRGREAARYVVRTPGPVARMTLAFDVSGRPPAHGPGHRASQGDEGDAQDYLFAYATLRDGQGTVLPDAWLNVAFGAAGGAALVGANPLATDAGISGILVRTRPAAPPAAVYALTIVPEPDGARSILAASAAVSGRAPDCEIRYTLDGSEPGPAARRYTGMIPDARGLRAGLLVGGRLVASLTADAPRFRMPASAPPPPEWVTQYRKPAAG